MRTACLIPIDEFCTSHNLEISFIRCVEKSGLIELLTVRDDLFIEAEQLRQLEKIVHLYFELDINLEGIETIVHLLRRNDILNQENVALRNRLRLYELEA